MCTTGDKSLICVNTFWSLKLKPYGHSLTWSYAKYGQYGKNKESEIATVAV